ncbi:MAG: hypothetical protein ACRCX2_10315 [Paraclostridium sp.]
MIGIEMECRYFILDNDIDKWLKSIKLDRTFNKIEKLVLSDALINTPSELYKVEGQCYEREPYFMIGYDDEGQIVVTYDMCYPSGQIEDDIRICKACSLVEYLKDYQQCLIKNGDYNRLTVQTIQIVDEMIYILEN